MWKKAKINIKGITLVTLAIAIVVIMILAGVTINIVTETNGLIAKSKAIASNAEQAEEEAQLKINSLKAEGVQYTEDGTISQSDASSPTISSITTAKNCIVVSVNITETGSGLEKIEYSKDGGNTWVTDPTNKTAKQYIFKNLQPGTYTAKVRVYDKAGNTAEATSSAVKIYGDPNYNSHGLPSTAETNPYLPTGFSKVEGTNLGNGLVIQDSTGNQYVWVEVPRTEVVYPTAGLEITNFTDTEYTAIENDLHKYTSICRNGTSYTDTYYADTDNTGWFTSAEEYNIAKKNMLKSVYKNGGFYVGRYETGIEGSYRTSAGIATQTPVIKANAYPYNYVTRTQAQTLASNMASGDRTSSLMFGVQWDLMLVFIRNKANVTDSTLTSDSKTIGNYNNNLWNITNTSSKYSTDYGASWTTGAYGEKTAEADVLLTTGADTSFGKMNIYDIAGNVWEWTLEYTSVTSCPCALRGGLCSYGGSDYPASSRNGAYSTVGVYSTGFRVSLY